MVFEGEGVPLEQDVLKKPIEFVRSWKEWAAENREQVFAGANTTETMFTVPANNTLWITGAWITISVNGNTASNAFAKINFHSTTTLLALRVRNDVSAEGKSGAISQSYDMPIKVESGTVEMDFDGSGDMLSGFHGFLVPKRIT